MQLGHPLHDLRSLKQTLPITLLLLTALLLSACQQPLDELAGTIPDWLMQPQPLCQNR